MTGFNCVNIASDNNRIELTIINLQILLSLVQMIRILDELYRDIVSTFDSLNISLIKVPEV